MFYFISPVQSIDLDFFSWLRKIEIISYYDKSKLVNVGEKKKGLLKNPTPVAEMSRTGLRNNLNKCERLRYDNDAIR